MTFLKAIFFFAAMLVPFAGMVGCSTGPAAGLPSLKKPANFGAPNQVPPERGIQTQAAASDSSDSMTKINRNHHRLQPTPECQVQQTSEAQPTGNATGAQPADSLLTLGSGDDFNKIVNHASDVVLVDFYADWCGPCKKQSGILKRMEPTAQQNGALIVKVNVDQHRDLAREYKVSSLPTLMLIKKGKVLSRQTGLANDQKIASMLKKQN